MLQLESGKTYQLKNGDVVTVRRNSLPYYQFSAVGVDPSHYLSVEVWTAEGVAYHHDCDFSVVREVIG